MKTRSIHSNEYLRGMLRAAVVSLFWNIVSYKRVNEGFSLKLLAEKLGINKSFPSRWFSGDRLNWEVNTIADIANALNVDIEVRATDRITGVVYTSYGVMRSVPETAAPEQSPSMRVGQQTRSPALTES